eukprot:TRINITY_DN78124_c0_g1_i1.p1 TRINITY_DN78124_c0_g1~~TRINITY_DN78124_c0_g1_i1.p1  ORF type:complete len:558 (-),score=131.67 TRINITY_DN78124_c0_g1_i1:37-1710(-)
MAICGSAAVARVGGGYVSPMRAAAAGRSKASRPRQSPPPRPAVLPVPSSSQASPGAAIGPGAAPCNVAPAGMAAVTPRSPPQEGGAQAAAGGRRMGVGPGPAAATAGAAAAPSGPGQVSPACVAGAMVAPSPPVAAASLQHSNMPNGIGMPSVRRNGSTTAIHPRQRRDSGAPASLSPPRPSPQALMENGFGVSSASTSAGPGRGSNAGGAHAQVFSATANLTLELEQERQRCRNFELQSMELMAQIEKLQRQAEADVQMSAQAQRRADAAEEQQAIFTQELERERRRAQKLEESFGGLTGAVEQLTRQAQAAAMSRGEDGASSQDAEVPLLKARIALLEQEVEAATRRAELGEKSFQAKDEECITIRRELQTVFAERAELDAIQVENDGKTALYLQEMINENNRRAGAISEREARIEELAAERVAWTDQFQALERKVEELTLENAELRQKVSVAEATAAAAIAEHTVGLEPRPMPSLPGAAMTPAPAASPLQAAELQSVATQPLASEASELALSAVPPPGARQEDSHPPAPSSPLLRVARSGQDGTWVQPPPNRQL